jgi:hypothetical protein
MLNGKRNGPGVYIWPNGARYEGEFKDDQIEGIGRIKNSEGVKCSGKFKNNFLITKLDYQIKSLNQTPL